jgi:TRAP transporter TAXI family solute receptor
MTKCKMTLLALGASVVAIGATTAIAAEKHSITFHTGSVGGLYMEPSVVWIEQWKEAIPNLDISAILGGSMTNPLKVSATADPNTAIGWSTLPLARDAMIGDGDYEKRAPGGIKNLRALWRVNNLTWGEFIVRPNAVPADVTTLGEFLAKKPKVHWALKTKGSGAESMTRILLKLYGVTYDDLQSWGGKVSFNNTSDAAKLIIDGHADVFVNAMPVPASDVLDMDASVKGLKWLALDQKQLQMLAGEYGYIAGDHPVGHYQSLPKSIPLVAYDHLVFVPEGMDEELVYKLTKTVLSNPQKVQALPSFETFDPKLAGTQTVFPLHPGAKRAYEELGLPTQ